MRGTIKPRNLRQQVTVERKRRNAVFFTVTALAFLYLGGAILFGDMGLFKYIELKSTKSALEAEIQGIENENKKLKGHVGALKEDHFYIEKYAREEYGLAKPDEYIFQFKEDGR
jgi:cell division protein FtsB